MSELDDQIGEVLTEAVVKGDWPSVTQEPLAHVDKTPNEEFPLRILKAHRANCDVFWEVEGLDIKTTVAYDLMNEHQRQRAEILDRAIQVLEDAQEKTHAD